MSQPKISTKFTLNEVKFLELAIAEWEQNNIKQLNLFKTPKTQKTYLSLKLRVSKWKEKLRNAT